MVVGQQCAEPLAFNASGKFCEICPSVGRNLPNVLQRKKGAKTKWVCHSTLPRFGEGLYDWRCQKDGH
jgi:hypothetical protein